FLACQVADEQSVNDLFAQAAKLLGGLDLAVNNAGIADLPADLHEMPMDTWDGVMAVDLRGVFLCLRAELRLMLEAGHGAMANRAPAAGVKTAPGRPPYPAANPAAIGLTKTAALHSPARGIRINAICPATISTPAINTAPAALQREWAALIPM